MLRLSTLEKLEPSMKLADVSVDIAPPFATHKTPRKEVETVMFEQ